MSATPERLRIISFRISPEVKRAVEERTAAIGRETGRSASFSEFVRRAISDALQAQEVGQ